jgi:hypothetical protein
MNRKIANYPCKISQILDQVANTIFPEQHLQYMQDIRGHFIPQKLNRQSL